MSLPIEQAIADLADSGKVLSSSMLAELSNLGRKEIELLKQAWPTIETKRRQQVTYRLVDLAEDNIELNFDRIFIELLKDPDAEIRSKAIEGLGESEEVSLIVPLIYLLEQDKSEEVQAAAATALGKYALLAEHKKLHTDTASRVEKALLAVMSDASKPTEIRRRALEAASPLSLPQVEKAIREAYQSHDSRLVSSAIYAMGKNCNPAWLPILLDELNNSDAEIRYEAAGACGELEEKEAVPSLIGLTNDTDTDVRLAAIQALGRIGGTEAKKCLEQCLRIRQQAIRQAAEEALLELETLEDPLIFPNLKSGNGHDHRQQD